MFNSTWQVSAFISLQTSCMGGDAFNCCYSLPCSLYPKTFCIACKTLEDVALSVLWLERFVWLWLILIAYFFHRPNSFVIITANRVIHCNSDTPEEMHHWISLLQKPKGESKVDGQEFLVRGKRKCMQLWYVKLICLWSEQEVWV